MARAFAESLSLYLHPRWEPLPHQIPPEGNWYGWLMLGGRGSGKTDSCANYMNKHALGPPCISGPVPHWMGIIAPTLGDAATSGYYGPSGLRAHNPETKLVSSPGGTIIRWPNGAEAKLFGALKDEDVQRLRSGGNRCLNWCEELAAWRYIDSAWDNMKFGLRLGPHPHWVGSTTPKPRQLIKDLVSSKYRNVVLTHATTDDNPHLIKAVRDELYERYGQTSLGAQELLGRLIDQDENALWTREVLDQNRVNDLPNTLQRITVGVDPSGGQGEQGIVAVGRCNFNPGDKPHGFVLGDYTARLQPAGWGKRAVQCAVDFDADNIAVETNFGGDMAIAVIQQALDQAGLSIPVKKVIASRGKRPRAEPVAALASNGRFHHNGVFEQLEDQLCIWTPEADYSPDRLDAMVWGGWQTKLVSTLKVVSTGQTGLELMSRYKVS